MWDDRYKTDEYIFGTDPNAFLVSVSDRIPKGQMLSIAEGEGRNAVYLAKLGFDVTAVDQSAVGLQKAEKLAKANGVNLTTIISDLADFDFGQEKWDAVISIFCHLPSDLRREVHSQIIKGLKRGGMLILEAYTPDQLNYDTGGPGDPQLLMTLKELRGEFKSLEFIIARETLRDVIDNGKVVGQSAVVQILAKKP